MEGAGKLIDDDELREAMQEKGLGTPATRAAIIEGLIYEKYIHREGRELVPGAKAFQLMTLLRGLGVEDLTKPELTGNWEHQLAEMEKGRLERETFMRSIAEMRRHRQGKLPPLRLHRHSRRQGAVRLLDQQDPGRARLRAGRGRGVPARQADRPARGLSLEGGLAVHGRAQARPRRRDQELEARVRLRRGRQARGRVG
jgi:hypothetical protein